MYRILCNILQFNFVYLSNNTNSLTNLEMNKVANLGYDRVNLFVAPIFYFDKYPVIGRKQVTHGANILKNNTVSTWCLEIVLNRVNLQYVYSLNHICSFIPCSHDESLRIRMWKTSIQNSQRG